jgi:hypothetical protein
MKAHDNGCFFSCTVSSQDISKFNSRWPCSRLKCRNTWFQFDKRNGDLVDIEPVNVDGAELLALSHDAQNYAAKKLNLPEHCFRNP